jgi:hypothetical protein
MKKTRLISALFFVSAFYDGILGIAFLAAAERLFAWLDITPPNHFGYVQFSAALLIVFAIMFLVIAISPVKNRNLIPYGILLKLSYCGIVFYYWLVDGIPYIWKPFAVCDLGFMVLYVIAFIYLTSHMTNVDNRSCMQ